MDVGNHLSRATNRMGKGRICQKMSLNLTACNDGQGIGKHTGGSISFLEDEFNMKQQKGESYEYH